ncbi:MAG TPA: carboxymuconolactone decarboxylase family protein [Sphaerochaeta sp.]|nr:carboxymuconolactone decarboxylase family protein [Sphaerochaeta sp.]
MQHASKPTVYRWRGLQGPGPSFQDCGKTSKARKQGLLDKHFMERIMLGVTQVNGCPLCSYAHTKMALEMGMQEEQIEELLGGELKNIPQEQLKAVLFGQHYAEMKGMSISSYKHHHLQVQHHQCQEEHYLLFATWAPPIAT